MIRPVTPADVPELVTITAGTGVFKPMEVDTLRQVFDEYFEYEQAAGSRCFVLEMDGELLGFEYHAPEEMTVGTWTLWWIVVRFDLQGQGIGRKLLEFAEADAREKGGGVLFVETSGTPHYEATRRFYLKYGYDQEARLRDYYAPGDDQIVFRKAL